MNGNSGSRLCRILTNAPAQPCKGGMMCFGCRCQAGPSAHCPSRRPGQIVPRTQRQHYHILPRRALQVPRLAPCSQCHNMLRAHLDVHNLRETDGRARLCLAKLQYRVTTSKSKRNCPQCPQQHYGKLTWKGEWPSMRQMQVPARNFSPRLIFAKSATSLSEAICGQGAQLQRLHGFRCKIVCVQQA